MESYLWTWFVPDVLTAIPVALILRLAPGIVADASDTRFYLLMSRVSVLLRLMKSSRIGWLQDFKNRGILQPSKITMLKLIFVFVLIIHMVACTYHFIVVEQDEKNMLNLEDDAWPVQRWHRMNEEVLRSSSFGRRYKTCLYWALVATLGANSALCLAFVFLFITRFLPKQCCDFNLFLSLNRQRCLPRKWDAD